MTKKKKLLIAATAFLVVAALAATALLLWRSSPYTVARHGITVLGISNQQIAVVFDGQDAIVLSDVQERLCAQDGTAVLYLDTEQTLYLLRQGKSAAEQIDEDVVAASAYFSVDGESFSYKRKEGERFVRYVIQTDSLQRQASFDEQGLWRLSPDLQTAVYKQEDGYYLYRKEQMQKIQTAYNVIAVSNNGKYIYTKKKTENGTALYVQKGKDGQPLCLTEQYTSLFNLNRDGTQILYRTKEGYFLSEKGKAGVQVGNDAADDGALYPLVTPPYAVTTHSTSGQEDYERALNIEDFEGKLVVGKEGIYRLSRSSDQWQCLANSVRYQLSANGKELLYVENNGLYRIGNVEKPEKTRERCLEGVNGLSFKASANLKEVYAVDGEGTVYYLSGNAEAQKVAGIQDRALHLCLSADQKTCFFISQEKLYYTIQGSAAQVVSAIDGKVLQARSTATHTVVVTDTAVYQAETDAVFTKLSIPEEAYTNGGYALISP